MSFALPALVVLGMAVSQAPAAAPSPSARPSPDPGAFHAVFLKLGPRWDPAVPVRQQAGIGEHGRYMTELTANGVLVLGGPFLEDTAPRTASGAMVVLATADAAEARRLMEADPGVRAGLFAIGDVRRFYVATGTWRPWHQP